jgi:hypothetical protein
VIYGSWFIGSPGHVGAAMLEAAIRSDIFFQLDPAGITTKKSEMVSAARF